MLIGSAGRAGAEGCAAPDADSTPARKPASQARCTGFAGPTTRLSMSTSSSENGAFFGMVAKLDVMTGPASPMNARQNAEDDQDHQGRGNRHQPAVERRPRQEALRLVRQVGHWQAPVRSPGAPK